MKLIAGLGNPGLKYKNTRHNIGFSVVEKLAKELGIKFNKKQDQGLIGVGKINSEKVILLKPLTYMNLSGLSIKEAGAGNKISLGDLLVVCDDINLKLGTLRLRTSGSDGGHNGLKSIIKELGSGDFARLRLGIGTGKENNFLADFVLSPFTRSEKKYANEIIDTAVWACLNWFNFGAETTMNKFNKHWTSK